MKERLTQSEYSASQCYRICDQKLREASVRALKVGLRRALASRAQAAATGAMRRAFITSAAFAFLLLVFAQLVRAQDQECPNATSTLDIISCYHNVIKRTEAEVQGKYQQILNL